MNQRLYMVFDVESIGLHGEGFAVGWVVVDESGKELDSGYSGCDPAKVKGDAEDRAWIGANVVPHLPPPTTPVDTGVHVDFINAYDVWKPRGAMLVADCAWPVEARFLCALVDQGIMGKWDGPYPLHDVATMRLAAGLDPLATVERLPSELPAHHPTADARQSARLWIEALAAIRQRQEVSP